MFNKRILYGFIIAFFLIAVLCNIRCHAATAHEKIADVVSEKDASEKAQELISQDMLGSIIDSFTDGIRDSVKSFTSVFAAMLFASFVLGMMKLSGIDNAALYSCEICLCALSFFVVSGVCESISAIVGTLRDFMLASLPVMTALYTASSAPATAAVNHGTTLVLLNVCNVLFTSVILPGVKCITVLATVSFISQSFDYTGLSRFVKNTVGWLFGLLMCLMASVIAFQNVVSAAKDGVMGRTIRFAASRFIPVIGNTVSESARTVSESLHLVRSVFGVSGIFYIVAVIASPVAALLVCRFFLNVCSACTCFFSCTKATAFFNELSGVMNLLLGVVIGISLIFVLMLGIFAVMTFAM